MAGNICRCGAYANIVEAIASRRGEAAPMKTFEFRARHHRRGRHQQRRRDRREVLAGGTNLLDLMKGGVEAPPALVDLRRLGLTHITATESGGVLIESGVTNSAIANHPLIRSQYPVLSQAILSAGRPPNCATWPPPAETCCSAPVARTSCRRHSRSATNATPGRDARPRTASTANTQSSVPAMTAWRLIPSDMAVALAILDATVHVQGPRATQDADRRLLPTAG